jgi:hypothetical protein
MPISKIDTAALAITDLAYTGTLTGGAGVVNLGSGQFYKDASGNIGVNTSSPNAKLTSATASGATAVSAINLSATVTGAETNYLSFFGTSNTGSVFSTPLTQIGAVSQNGSFAAGALVFHTTPFSGVSTERLRITSEGILSQVGDIPTRKNEISGAITGAKIKKVEEMVNFYHARNSSRYFKLNIASRYANSGQGGLVTLTFGKFSEHASRSHLRVYKLFFGSGTGGDPSGYEFLFYTEKEIAVGWDYYNTTFGFDVFYPSAGSNRNYVYIRLTNADNQGSTQSPHGFLHLEGFIASENDSISGKVQTLEDIGTTQPSDWGNFTAKTSNGAW